MAGIGDAARRARILHGLDDVRQPRAGPRRRPAARAAEPRRVRRAEDGPPSMACSWPVPVKAGMDGAPWWTFDSHTVEKRPSRIKPPSERRPHHHRNSYPRFIAGKPSVHVFIRKIRKDFIELK
jgi:hypothetical protein